MKKCISCEQEKELSEFGWKSKEKGTLQPRCKSCYNEYNRQYYNTTDRQKQVKRVVERSKKLAEMFQQWKAHQQCAVCGEADTECLDLHHRDPSEKEGTLGRLNSFGSWEAIEAEVAKCTVLCANCHRRVHSGRISLLS